MGAVTFSIDPKLIEALLGSVPIEVFVETGTCLGDTVEMARRYFKEVYSIELIEYYWERARSRFEGRAEVHILQGDSPEVLRDLVQRIGRRPTLFWLDAHWGPNDAGDDEPEAGAPAQCPLLRELEAIGELVEDSAIVIDDARLFMASPRPPYDHASWPSLDVVVESLQRLSRRHRMTIVNDCIIYVPEKAAEAMVRYARRHGVDWLRLADMARESERFLADLEEKEEEIQRLAGAAEERLRLIERLHRELEVLRSRLPPPPTKPEHRGQLLRHFVRWTRQVGGGVRRASLAAVKAYEARGKRQGSRLRRD